MAAWHDAVLHVLYQNTEPHLWIVGDHSLGNDVTKDLKSF